MIQEELPHLASMNDRACDTHHNDQVKPEGRLRLLNLFIMLHEAEIWRGRRSGCPKGSIGCDTVGVGPGGDATQTSGIKKSEPIEPAALVVDGARDEGGESGSWAASSATWQRGPCWCLSPPS